MGNSTPLIQSVQDAPIACLTLPLNNLRSVDQKPIAPNQLVATVSKAAFLNHVLRLSAILPSSRYVINLCDNRYVFLVTVCAAIVNRQTCLLPANKNTATQRDLAERYPSGCVVHDGVVDIDPSLDSLDAASQDWSLCDTVQAMPSVPLEHLSIISFTSGSTGDSKPNLKSWRTLQESSRINARYMLPNDEQTFYQLATVPGQHMWGLETSVLLPLFANACLVDSRPLFPHDVRQALFSLPSPRTLITTPVHLRSLVASLATASVDAVKIDLTLCATAPLDQQLAIDVEAGFGCELREVYGCSEVGSMSVRRTAKTLNWTRFSGIDFTAMEDGRTRVKTDYLPASVVLEDKLRSIDADTFELIGRASDQIKIAGKRGSLADINLVVNRYEGVLDGVVFFPPQARQVPRLVALVVLKPGYIKAQLMAFLRAHLDAAFVPRPTYVVDSLPREANGKLPNASVMALYQELRIHRKKP